MDICNLFFTLAAKYATTVRMENNNWTIATCGLHLSEGSEVCNHCNTVIQKPLLQPLDIFKFTIAAKFATMQDLRNAAFAKICKCHTKAEITITYCILVQN